MPSDPRTQLAIEALAEPCTRFRVAVESARDQMRAYIAAHRPESDGRTNDATLELGSFASGRIDTGRFASVFSVKGNVGYEVIARIERCIAVLDDLLSRGEALFIIDVPRGSNAGVCAANAYATAGRAFGAVLAFQAAKTGNYRDDQHDKLLESFAFDRWNRSERLMSPPLVIEIDGDDFTGDQLAGFIDGNARIIVVVRGASSPAPLARLITPGVLVIQSVAADALSMLAGFEGPVVASLVPGGAATFVHDPRRGSALKDRLVVETMPELPSRAVGRRSVWQQREEIAQLSLLAKLAAEENAQVDTLANWLMQAGGLSPPSQADAAQ
jgi:hypothetical protein